MGWLTPDVLKVGEGGLLALVFMAMVLGYIVPIRVANKLTAEANKSVELWKQIAASADKRADLAVKQSGEMIAGFDTLAKLINSQTVSAKETR